MTYPPHRPLRVISTPGLAATMKAAAEDEAAQARLNALMRSTRKIDTTALNAAMVRIRESFQEMGRQLVEVMRTALQPLLRFMQRIVDDANDPVHVAGLEAKFYVRAAMWDYTPDQHKDHRLVQRVLAGDVLLGMDVALLTPDNRRAVAVAAMRGLAEVGLEEDDTRGGCDSVQWGSTRRELVLL